MAVSNKILQFMEEGSWIRKMFEEGAVLKEKYGEENVFDLSLGNPVVEPPQEFFEELRFLANASTIGTHRYMPNAGYVDTRESVAKKLRIETELEFTSDNILMTCGAGGALNVVMKALLNPGDEVVIFAPYFVEYRFYADNHGGSCKIVSHDKSFYPDMRELRSNIGPKTKIVLINSPNNPTGVVYSEDVIAQISQVIRDKEEELGTEIFLVSDEPYRKIIFDDIDSPHVFGFHVRSIVATSHSKDLALPGERIGYIADPPDNRDASELMHGLIFCNRTLGFVNAPALMQHIVKKLQFVTVNVQTYKTKRDFLYENLVSLGYSVVKPQGAFYMFPESPIEDEVAFVQELQKHRVLVVPGRGFGSPGHFRISYCVNDNTLKGSVKGFRDAIASISK